MNSDVPVFSAGSARTVLMTSEATGGIFTYSMTLASELAKTGTKTHLVMMGAKARPSQVAALRSVPGLVLHETNFGLDWAEQPWEDVARGGEWLRGLEAEVAPDIVHLNGFCHGAAGFKAPVVVVAHSCAVSSWESIHKTTLPDRLERYKDAAKRGLRAAHAVIAVSPSVRASVDRHYGPLARAAVIPNGLGGFAQTSLDKEHFILSAGRITDRAKNVELLARAAPRLAWPVKLAGVDALDPNVFGHVESVGWLPPNELGELMARASIFAAPARYEPFGLSILEAALRGCALVLGDIPSLRELWQDAAVYADVDDESSLVRAIGALVDDAARREEYAAKAKFRAQLFTGTRHARAMADLYETMLFARRSPVVVGTRSVGEMP